MGSWYRVIKIKRGHRYLYLQRTQREGQKVRTENLYLGPVADDPRSPVQGIRRTIAYHGARTALEGPPAPSAAGHFGPGLYLADLPTATTYARYDPKVAATLTGLRNLGDRSTPTPAPQHDGTVHAFDLTNLDLFTVSHARYLDLGARLLKTGRDYVTREDAAAIAERLATLGFDGLEIFGRERREIVIFPGSVAKLQAVTTTPGRIDAALDERKAPKQGAARPATQLAATHSLGGVYGQITDRIVADLERGVRPWHQPWKAGARGSPPLRHNGEPYSGINVLMLWAAAQERGFSSPHWMTFLQAKELGGSVRKGEKGTKVVHASTFTRTEKDEDGEEKERRLPFFESYTVFNVDQIEGLPASYAAPAPEPGNPRQRIEHAEAFFAATGADIRHGGSRAYYSVDSDYLQMPPFEAFDEPEAHAATLAHELIHWTRHPSRLGRDFGRKSWGDEGYAREELVAELGAAFLCADLGITPRPREEHAAYIASWIEALENDKRAIFSAAAHAQKAVDYLHSLRPGEPSERR